MYLVALTLSIKPLCGTFEILMSLFSFFFLIRKFKNLVFVLFSLFVIFYSHCCTSCVELFCLFVFFFIGKLKNLFFAVVLLFTIDCLCLSSFSHNHFMKILTIWNNALWRDSALPYPLLCVLTLYSVNCPSWRHCCGFFSDNFTVCNVKKFSIYLFNFVFK
jgi:hypothetical protein